MHLGQHGLVATLLLFSSCGRLDMAWSAGAKFQPAISVTGAYNIALDSSKEDAASLIVPGERVGKLKLGDSRDRLLELFPYKNGVDQTWKCECGSMLNWVETSNVHKGNLFILIRDGDVVQIGAATTRYHTAQALTVSDSPDLVQRYFKNLRAYMLVGLSSSALGDRPLIFWVDQGKGIAFEFAYFPDEHRRYLYEVLVFKPGGEFCPEGRSVNATNWRELPAYALDAPDAKT